MKYDFSRKTRNLSQGKSIQTARTSNLTVNVPMLGVRNSNSLSGTTDFTNLKPGHSSISHLRRSEPDNTVIMEERDESLNETRYL